MTQCPVCNSELSDDSAHCHICGYELDETDEVNWVVVGEIDDKISADFAREILSSYEIPAVIFSRSGFFGSAGLPLNPFYKAGSALFEVSVPEGYREEALDILDSTLGSKWHGKDK